MRWKIFSKGHRQVFSISLVLHLWTPADHRIARWNNTQNRQQAEKDGGQEILSCSCQNCFNNPTSGPVSLLTRNNEQSHSEGPGKEYLMVSQRAAIFIKFFYDPLVQENIFSKNTFRYYHFFSFFGRSILLFSLAQCVLLCSINFGVCLNKHTLTDVGACWK